MEGGGVEVKILARCVCLLNCLHRSLWDIAARDIPEKSPKKNFFFIFVQKSKIKIKGVAFSICDIFWSFIW